MPNRHARQMSVDDALSELSELPGEDEDEDEDEEPDEDGEPEISVRRNVLPSHWDKKKLSFVEWDVSASCIPSCYF